MSGSRVFVRWLALAALADWLLARTITRAAIFMPKSPPVLAAFEVMTVAGQLATTLAALLALGAIGWLAWQTVSLGKHPNRPRLPQMILPTFNAGALPGALLGMLVLSLVFLVLPPAGWPSVGYHTLFLIAIVSMGQVAWRHTNSARSLAWLAVAAALALGELYQLGSALGISLRWSEPPAVTAWLFNAGEACVVAGGFALWRAYGRGGSWRAWLVPGILAFAFVAAYFVNPEMSGVLAIWSIGLTLYLPWPLYAASFCLAGVTVVVSLRRDSMAAWAILLLASGGYAPQLSSQAFFGLVGLWLLLSPAPRAGLQCLDASQAAGERLDAGMTHKQSPVAH